MVIASLGRGVSTRLRLERKRLCLSRLPLVLYIELITAGRGGGRRQIGANNAEKLTTRSKSDHVTLVQIVQPRRTQRRAEGEKDRSFSAYLRRPLRLDVPILVVLI